jgi:hypothetical protein
LVLLILFVSETVLAQPPGCTINVNATSTWTNQNSRNIGNNQVLCINGPGKYKGTITVQSGGHIVVCGGNVAYKGTLVINPGGKYWRTPTSRFTNSGMTFLNHGTSSNSAANCASPPAPEINLQGNGQNISDSDTSPSTADDTDFGSALMASGSVTRTYTIQNTGTGALTISSTITSSNALFTITQPSSTSIAAGGSQTFDVTFDPSAAGVHTSTINIPNDDSDENPYQFDVKGEVSGPPVPISTVISGNFSNPTTWNCNCVPQPSDNVTVNNNISVDTDYDQLTGSSFTISNGNTVTVLTGNKLSIAGNLINSGIISGDLELSGTSLQIPDLGTVENLEINNAAGVTLTADLDITGYLKLTDGTLNTDGYNLTLKSSSTQTALIIDDAGNINGNTTIERFVPEVGLGHHFLSSPLNNALISALNDDYTLDLTGSFPNIYYYDEAISDWQVPSSISDPMITGIGYTGYFSGNSVIDLTGDAHSGITNIPITNTSHGWNLVGNPYPSPIDWDVITLPTGVANAVYVWDHDPSSWGSYTAYVDNVSVNGGTNIIPSMQSFFINSTVATTMIMDNNVRLSTVEDNGNFYKMNTSQPLLRLTLNHQQYSTEAVIRFKQGATINYDLSYDALHLSADDDSAAEFALKASDQNLLVINTLPDSSLNQSIGLYFKTGSYGNYSIDLSEFNQFSSSGYVELEDMQLSTSHILNTGPYNFIAGSNDIDNRFIVHVRSSTVSTELVEDDQNISLFEDKDWVNINFESGNLVEQTLSVYSIDGKLEYQTIVPAGVNVHKVPAKQMHQGNIYIFRLEASNQVFKLIKQ